MTSVVEQRELLVVRLVGFKDGAANKGIGV